MKAKEKIHKIAERYGYEAQSRQCMEECAELIQAINKYWRKDLHCGCEYNYLSKRLVPTGTEAYENLVEELADVYIMIQQMIYLLACDQEFMLKVNEKLDRQIKRMEAENGKE